MAYSMSSTNYMTKFELENSKNDDDDEMSSWDSYVDDSGSEYPSSLLSSSMVFDARNRKESFVDHDLEDTASSPSHSPKVINEFNELFTMSRTMNTMTRTKEMESSLLETELRRKGLCLVPISMVVNCIGSNI